MPQLGPSPMEAFQIGQSLNGPSALGQFAMAITQRANQLKLFQEQTDIQTKAEIEKAGPLAKAKAEAEAAANPFTPLINQQVKNATAGGGSPSDFTMTGFNTQGVANFESPTAAGKIAGTKAAEQLGAQQTAKIVPRAEAFVSNLKSIAQLSRQIPPPKAGPGRILESLGLAYKGYTQEIPQITLVERKRQAVVGQLVNLVGGEGSSRLSDQDVKRVLGLLSSPVDDTQKLRDLSNVELLDALNDIPEVKAQGGLSYLNVLTPQEILSGRGQQGKQGGKLRQDASGAIAIRYPDGTIEELF